MEGVLVPKSRQLLDGLFDGANIETALGGVKKASGLQRAVFIGRNRAGERRRL